MGSRQIVIEVGDWSIKAGLWEQSFLPTLIIPSFGSIVDSKWKEGNFYDTNSPPSPPFNINPIISGNIDHLELLFRHLFSRLFSLDDSTLPSTISPIFTPASISTLIFNPPPPSTLTSPSINPLPISFKDVFLFFIIPGDWNLEKISIMTKLFYDRLQVGGVYWIGESLSASFSVGTISNSALVINIGHFKTNIAIINENQICRHLKETVLRGGHDIDQFIHETLKKHYQHHQEQQEELISINKNDQKETIHSESHSPSFITLDKARIIKEQALSSGKSHFIFEEENQNQNDKSTRTNEFNLDILIENESKMYDRLFDDFNFNSNSNHDNQNNNQDDNQKDDTGDKIQSKDLESESIKENGKTNENEKNKDQNHNENENGKNIGILTAIYNLISRFDMIERKSTLLENIIITGPTTILPGFRNRFLERLRSSPSSPICKSEFHGEYQIKQTRLRTIPEYFSTKLKISNQKSSTLTFKSISSFLVPLSILPTTDTISTTINTIIEKNQDQGQESNPTSNIDKMEIDNQIKDSNLDSNSNELIQDSNLDSNELVIIEVPLWERAAPWMTWFGGGIGAKAALNDTRTMTTKEEWQEHAKQILYNIRF